MDQDTALRLLRTGAITEQQYRDLTKQSREVSQPLDSATVGAGESQASTFLKVTAAAGAGAITGSLAADLIESAVETPTPEVFEATVETTTVWTDEGYVTHGELTWEDADGELIAEADIAEPGSWGNPETVQYADHRSADMHEEPDELEDMDFF